MADSSFSELREGLKQSLRSILKNANTPQKIDAPNSKTRITSSFFHDLKENVKQIQTTHYSPAKLSQNVPKLPPKSQQRGENQVHTDSRWRDNMEQESPDKINKTNRENQVDGSPRIGFWTDQKKGSHTNTRSRIPVLQSNIREPAPKLNRPSREWTQILLNKVDNQVEQIDQLQSEIQLLRAANYRLRGSRQSLAEKYQVQSEQIEREREQMQYEREQMQRELAIAQMDRINNYVLSPPTNKHQNFQNKYEDFGLEDPFYESPRKPRIENVNVLQEFGPEAFYELRYNNLLAKFLRSLDISTFQARTIAKLANNDRYDDDTTNLILGIENDSTTKLLMSRKRDVYDEVYKSANTAKSRLRRAIFAVLFIERIKLAAKEK